LIILEPGLVSDHVVKEWLDSGQEVAAFWTGSRRAERPRFSQRVRAAASGAVPFGTLSKKLAVPVRLIDRLSRMPNLRQEIASTGADTLITLMTHQIVPSEVLEMFGRKAVNFHPALLPHYKGKAPRISMLVDGKAEEYGGITVHRLVREIDEGPLIGQRPLPWSKTPDYVIWDVAAALAAAEMVRCDLIPYLDGRFEARPQDPNEGNYRNCTKHEFDITPDKTLAAVMRLFECSPGFTHRWSPLSGAVRREEYPVVALTSVIGPPWGAPPRVTPLQIETDISDARIRLARRNPFHKAIRYPFWRLRRAVKSIRNPMSREGCR